MIEGGAGTEGPDIASSRGLAQGGEYTYYHSENCTEYSTEGSR